MARFCWRTRFPRIPPAQKTLYVSDLDGTLLNREDALSPRTIEVLHRLTGNVLKNGEEDE